MEEATSRCWAEVDLDVLEENYRNLKGGIPQGCKMMAILKANAYGHGIVDVGRALELFSDDWYGVATFEEAMELRNGGIQKPILVLGYTPPVWAKKLAEHAITQTLISNEYAGELAENARAAGVTVQAHVKLDTGMSRIGLMGYGAQQETSIQQVAALYHTKGLHVTGIFTHCATLYEGDADSEAYSALQYERFTACCAALAAQGIALGLRHFNNSAGTINRPEWALDMCRVGTALYGILPTKVYQRPMELRPVLCLKARVILLKDLEENTPISYSRMTATQKKTRIAVLSVGYADGYPRQMSNLGRALIRTHSCPILGRVCMDMMIVDSSDAPEICVGDEAVLMGEQGDEKISCEELFRPCGTGPSDIVCRITARPPRVYQKQK